MRRRSFLGALLALPAFFGPRRSAPPTAADDLPVGWEMLTYGTGIPMMRTTRPTIAPSATAMILGDGTEVTFADLVEDRIYPTLAFGPRPSLVERLLKPWKARQRQLAFVAGRSERIPPRA